MRSAVAIILSTAVLCLAGCSPSVSTAEDGVTAVTGWVRTSALGEKCESLQGQQLVVSDSTGTKLAVAQLGPPVVEDGDCHTSFEIELQSDPSGVLNVEMSNWQRPVSTDLSASDLVASPYFFFAGGQFGLAR